MNQKIPILRYLWFVIAITASFAACASNSAVATQNEENKVAPIPMDQLGAVAGKQYQGDGLSVSATLDGARLRCAFQRLEGHVTREGLWLSSTADGLSGERFRVRAMEVGRVTPCAPLKDFNLDDIWSAELRFGSFLSPTPDGPIRKSALPPTGIVNVADNVARFIRPGLTEEYSVSVDGVRQDFIIEQRSPGDGELRVELEVTGARVEPLINGARLVLDGSGRKFAYNRLRVVDARGQELTARLEVKDSIRLAVVVDDAIAIYPVRIDPTFSDADWVSMGVLPGTDGNVEAAVADDTGNLYIGGSFTTVGDVLANRIAKWDGNQWSAMGTGMNSSVNALAVSGTNLYAGGTSANYIAKWDGTTWISLGSGVNGTVHSLAASGSELYAGGWFTMAGTNSANHVAKWNGSTWSALGSGLNSTARALAVSGTNLYAGGQFTAAGGNTANYIAKWNGSSWSSLGLGMNSVVYALAISGTDLYAGGVFTMAGSVSAGGVAKWDGSAWTVLGSGVSSGVLALGISGNDLYASGIFATAGGGSAKNVARWNGSTWSALGTGLNSTVTTIALSGSNVFVGGYFTTAGDSAASKVAKWNGSQWLDLVSNPAHALSGSVNALAVSATNLFVGGSFTTAGNLNANRIAKWDGNMWSTLGSGLSSPVNALAVWGADLYAGGSFTTAGGSNVNYVARWNGIEWSALGSGVTSTVNALAISGGDLYAGGTFMTAGGGNAARIAKWNGNVWSALGAGVNGTVNAIAISGTNLYVGGGFDIAGGTSASRIAKWNGTTWSALGAGIPGLGQDAFVSALAISGTDLYAGGRFKIAGSVAATNIAKWDGAAWSTLGSGILGLDFGHNALVATLAVSGTDLYAGGDFITAGGTAVNRIAKWDGNAWSALGSGANGTVNALAVSGTNLFAGGAFTTAGNKVSAYVAKANIGAARGRFSGIAYSPATGFSCTFFDASVGQPYRIQTSPSLVAGSWTDFTNFTYTGPIVITDASAISSTNKFFRAITP